MPSEPSERVNVRVRVCDPAGVPVPGFDSGFLFGDALSRAVPFGGDLRALLKQPVRLEFFMSDADLYAMTCADSLPAHMK